MSLLMHQAMLMAGGGAAGASVSLLHLDGTDGSTTFTDEYGKAWTRNGTNTHISTTQSKFGGASMAVGDGTQTGPSQNNGITTPNHTDFIFGTGDFTIDWQQYWLSFTTFQTVFDKGRTAGDAILLQTGAGDGAYRLYLGGSTSAGEGSAPSLNTWVQYQLRREGNLFTMTRDGVVTATVTTAFDITNTGTVGIGAYADGTYPTNSFIDEFRITKGLARPYTPQGAPWAS